MLSEATDFLVCNGEVSSGSRVGSCFGVTM